MTDHMSAPSEAEAFAEVLIVRRGVLPDSMAADDCRRDVAALLASPAMAERDARVRAEALREASDALNAHDAWSLGVVRWLRDRADQQGRA